jgi:Ca2+-binding RTX toxin-like protein
LKGGGADDLIDGGAGADDLVSLDDAPKPTTVDLFAGFSTGRGNDTIVAVENILGSIWPDLLRGNADANEMDGGSGEDFMEGREGNDTLIGGLQKDFADGGPDTDSCTAESTQNCE